MKILKIRYRSGFFGLTDDEVDTVTAKAKLTPSQQIDNALTSPFAKNDINVRLASLFGDAAGSSFVRVFLNIQSKDLTFTDEADGSKTAVFDVFAFVFAGNGLPVEQSSKRYSFHINRETYKQISGGGFVYNFNMPVKNPGAYQLRLALRDIVTQKIGSASQFIEVPDLKKNKLTLSGIMLQNFTPEEWQKTQSADALAVSADKTQRDTAVRHFKRGLILSFGYTIYNAKHDKERQPNLQTQTRLYREQKMILEGQPKLIDLSSQ